MDLLEEQVAYYKARAPEYDDWWYRRGRYDRGEQANESWLADVKTLDAALEALAPFGDVLELAPGTGIWTEKLAKISNSVAAVDASEEMLAINAAKLAASNVRYAVQDLFTWQPDKQYDLVFFSFWLSHLPEDKFERFWDTVRTALKPGGTVFLIDSLFTPDSTARNHNLHDPNGTTVKRKLNDGREFEIVKIFRTPKILSDKLEKTGWQTNLHATKEFFLYGTAKNVHSQ